MNNPDNKMPRIHHVCLPKPTKLTILTCLYFILGESQGKHHFSEESMFLFNECVLGFNWENHQKWSKGMSQVFIHIWAGRLYWDGQFDVNLMRKICITHFWTLIKANAGKKHNSWIPLQYNEAADTSIYTKMITIDLS